MTDESKSSPPPGGQFLVYQTMDGKLKIDVRFQGETVWLSLNQLAELFQTTKQNISLHIQNIFEEGELARGATVKESLTVQTGDKLPATTTVAKFATVQTEGKRTVSREIEFYNLDVIISVGYRVKSHVATRFRIWATQRLREYIVKGFVPGDEGLKYGYFSFRPRMILCFPPGRKTSATTGERFPRKASQIRRCNSSNVTREYSSPVSVRSGLAYSWPLRSVPLIVYSVTKTTARSYLARPSASVSTAGGINAEYGSPLS